MSDDKGILERAKEKFINAKDATKEKLGGNKHKLISSKGDSIERSKEIYDEGMDVTPEKLDEIAQSQGKKFSAFRADEIDDGIPF
uniref:PvLEA15 protein n=1 Tax=Polypedilum vanderplanki TaxID=319348 RepID=S6BEP8_POLVA|nr:PvLEA15 protein [Polypedilum vanderplanki]